MWSDELDVGGLVLGQKGKIVPSLEKGLIHYSPP